MHCLILSCTSVLSTLRIVGYYLNWFWSLINTSQCIEFNLLTIDFNLTWLQQAGDLKNNVTGWRSQNWWQLFISIWYQSLGWWWRWFNVSRNLFLTRISHHLVESFDSMNYHWFEQRNFSNRNEQDLSYNRWCHQHCHLVVSWPSCLNYLLVEQAVVQSAAAIH